MILNSDAKLIWTPIMWSQKWHEELGQLSLEHSESETFYTDGLFLSKAYNVLARKTQRNYVSWHKKVMQKFKGKLTRGLKNDIKNLVNFHTNSRKPGNFHYDGLLLPKTYKNLD